jgi:membrane protein
VGAVSGIDGFQRRHSVLGFPLAVIYKYFDDQGPYLASALTYYAFVAIFPLMLLGTSILGLFLRGEPQWQEQILNSALSQFPIIGDELGRPEGLQGSVAGVVFGALAALYGAMGLGQALQNTQHVAWSVPRNSRPNPIYARVKTLILLVTAGFSLLTVTVVSTLASSTDVFGAFVADGLKTFLPLITVAVVGTFLTLLFRFAATGQHSFWRAAPGGYSLAIMWQVLQIGGAAYVDNVLVDTSSMTKTFGLVLGLIGFLWIGAVMAVLAMEINVVAARRLWPRALLTPFTDNIEPTEADRKAYALYAGMQRHKGFEKVSVTWEPSPAEIKAAEAEVQAEVQPEDEPAPAPAPTPDDTRA